MCHLSNKTKKFKLDSNAANDMLQNILKSCDIEPNDIPLNILEVRHTQKFIHLHIARAVCIVLFLLTLFSPFAFVQPTDKVIVEHRVLHTLNVIEHRHEGDNFYIRLNSSFAVDLNASYIETDSGFKSEVIEYDARLNQLVFPYPIENATIYIYTTDGSLLQLYLQVL